MYTRAMFDLATMIVTNRGNLHAIRRLSVAAQALYQISVSGITHSNEGFDLAQQLAVALTQAAETPRS